MAATGSVPARPIDGVLFDLDDTLYLQETWLRGAWHAVATAAATSSGTDPRPIEAALLDIAGEGSDRGRIIDRALARAGLETVAVPPLVEVFREHDPGRLELVPGSRALLERLRRVVPVGLVTDGDPGIQRRKVAALGLESAFDVVVFSDELGRDHRKPHPMPFTVAARRLGVPPGRIAFVGDRPDKDIIGASMVGMTPIRVATGEYSDLPDPPSTWRRASDVTAAIHLLLAQLTVASRIHQLSRTGDLRPSSR